MNILECSSIGDKRFSAFYAKITLNGKRDSIENHYQSFKRFGNDTSLTWKEAKGKKPTHISFNGIDMDVSYLTPLYKLLWLVYLENNPDLVAFASQYDDFKDTFKGKNTVNCQADVIRQYVKEGRVSLIKETKDFWLKYQELKNA